MVGGTNCRWIKGSLTNNGWTKGRCGYMTGGQMEGG